MLGACAPALVCSRLSLRSAKPMHKLPAFLLLAWLPASVLAGLEATLIAVDNSGGMIAGDHPPSRLQCQYECVNLVCTVKTENPESCVGLMTMSVNPEKSCAPRTRTPSSATPLQQILKDGAAFSYDCPTVHITPTGNTEPGPILTALHKINKRPCHMCEFEDAMEVAWMCLSMRANKAQRPRIVAFVGTAVRWKDPRGLVRLGKKLRKAGCAVDIVSFGASPRYNDAVLKAFIRAVEKDGNCNFMSLPPDTCPPGGLSDALFSSPILASDRPVTSNAGDTGVAAPAAPSAPDLSQFGGVNPELDPELAMALKMSAQEEQERIARQAEVERAALAAKSGENGGGGVDASGDGIDRGSAEAVDEDLAAAIAASMQESVFLPADGGNAGEPPGVEQDAGDEMEDEDAMLQKALELSLREGTTEPSGDENGLCGGDMLRKEDGQGGAEEKRGEGGGSEDVQDR